jgi:RNA polymerase sigma-70 factor (ECF subfamily)
VDEEQAERLVNTYSDLILRLSYTYLHSAQDAEDICQTVFLKCLTSGQVFESRDHEKAWIIRTAVNACKDLLRSAHRQRTVGLEAPASYVLEAVMALPVKYRQVIYLYYYEGYSAREIGGLLGQSEASVNTYLSRGRSKLRALLKGDDYAHEIS